ncbi:MAG: hypothetical protein WD314_06370 [Trueperaceae bacterium]
MSEVRPLRRARVFISGVLEKTVPGRDIFERYRPPFDLEADMLFAATFVPTVELSRSFQSVQFLDIAGSTPLILWFSRVRMLCHGPAGQRQCLDETSGFGYNELNVVALLRARRLFVPVIYASGGLTQRLGHRYGMPKRPVDMTFFADREKVISAATFVRARSEARASLLASGRLLAKVVDWPAPWWSWPAEFPDGSFIRAKIQSVPRAQLALVSGTLALDEPWLPRSAPLWRPGLYVPGLRMRLPAPERELLTHSPPPRPVP